MLLSSTVNEGWPQLFFYFSYLTNRWLSGNVIYLYIFLSLTCPFVLRLLPVSMIQLIQQFKSISWKENNWALHYLAMLLLILCMCVYVDIYIFPTYTKIQWFPLEIHYYEKGKTQRKRQWTIFGDNFKMDLYFLQL